jgi:hypothetical protein
MLSVGEQHVAGIGHANQTTLRHFEQPEFIGGPKAMLYRTHHAQCVETVTFEADHCVDDVLE